MIFFRFVIFLFIECSKSEPVSINCSFALNNVTSRCDVSSDLKIYYENQEITIENVENRTNLTTFAVMHKIVHYFPQGINEYFPNLKKIQITSSGLKEITSKDLQNFPELEYLDLSHNVIEVLEENLFKFNKNLSEILLNNNTIKEVDPTAFNGPTRIKTLELIGNTCYSGNATNNALFGLVINGLKSNCWSEALDIKKFILGVTKMDNGIETMSKLMNFNAFELTKTLNHENSSQKTDSYDCDNSDLSLMDILTIINTFLLSLVTLTILTSKCCSNLKQNQAPADVHNKIYGDICKTSNGHHKILDKSKFFNSMELLEKNYHEDDECYDEISGAACKEEYSAVLNSEECEAVHIETEDLYSEVGDLRAAKKDEQPTDKETCDKEAMYAEVIKRSSGWI